MSHHHKFSWENHPEISKLTPQSSENPKHAPKLKLRPPPCPSDSPGLLKPGIYVPLPPCAFQPPPKKPPVLRPDDDPFFAAYMKCTKGGKSEKMRGGGGGGSWKEGFGISCKKSCGVRDDTMVRVSHVPVYHGVLSWFYSIL
ncbi:hypothetical protein J5N97_028479 [Dioscorea zingiberensis]|uniref:Uncharacterized protein n=1 Tax=Dioscorea zingiberensis TaxID=325984 RepID=A0A9D5BZH1_9LILI|nr:hypothetical protein J5N97_028479 [Dioscorea zingiberensis]